MLFDRIAQLGPLFRLPGPARAPTIAPASWPQRDLWFPPTDVPLRWVMWAGSAGRITTPLESAAITPTLNAAEPSCLGELLEGRPGALVV